MSKVFPQAEKKPRHKFTKEDCSRGGKRCAELHDMSARGQVGFWVTVTKYPWAKEHLGAIMSAKYPNWQANRAKKLAAHEAAHPEQYASRLCQS